MTLRMPRPLHAVGAERRRHRRLPLLPARPAPHAGPLPDRARSSLPGNPARRAPRDPVPRPTRTRSRPPSSSTRRTPARAGPASATAACRTATTSTTRRGSAPGRPGAQESVDAPGVRRAAGRPAAGSIMQVHYNLLAGTGPDRSATLLRLAPPSAHLTPLETMLLPAPGRAAVPPRPHRQPALRPRRRHRGRRTTRFGDGRVRPTTGCTCCAATSVTPRCTTCTRTINQTDDDPGRRRVTCTCSAARSGSQVDPGTPRARTILDIPVWDFDNQGGQADQAGHAARRATPSRSPAATSSGCATSCRRSQGQPDRYVVWGEGTTDEMCLGILTVTHP